MPGGARNPVHIHATRMSHSDQQYTFSSLQQAGCFLQQEGYPGSNHRNVLRRYAACNEPYCGFYWQVTDNEHPPLHPSIMPTPTSAQDPPPGQAPTKPNKHP
jgi:hypothetical protein